MRLRIAGKGPVGRGYKVWIDDVEQTRVSDVTVVMGVNGFNKATITYIGVEVDLDVEAIRPSRSKTGLWPTVEEPSGPQ